MSRMIIAERELQPRLLESAREHLGPDATEEEVQATADRAYYGPPDPEYTETEEQRRIRLEQHEENVAEATRVLQENGLL